MEEYAQKTDRDLAKLVRNDRSNQQAWEEIFRRYHELIYRIISRKFWKFDREDWRDIAQDIQIAFLKAIPKFRAENGCSLKTYLTGITLKTCNKRFQQMLHREERKQDIEKQLTHQDFPNWASPETHVLETEDEAELSELWTTLPENIRHILYLHYLEGITYKEIANLLQIRPDNLRQKAKRALSHIKKNLARKEISPEQFNQVGLRVLIQTLPSGGPKR